MCRIYIIQYTVYSMHYTLNTIWYTLYHITYTLYNAQYILYNTHHTASIQYTVYRLCCTLCSNKVQHTVYNCILCSSLNVYTAQCTVHSAHIRHIRHCTVCSVQCAICRVTKTNVYDSNE